MATVWIPALLRSFTDGQAQVEASGATVRELIDSLEARYPGLAARLCQEGRLNPTLQVTIDGRVAPRGLAAPVDQTSEVHFVPAVSGG